MSNKDLAAHIAAYVNGHMDPRVFGDVCRDVIGGVVDEDCIASHVINCCGTRRRRKSCVLTGWLVAVIRRNRQ